MIKIIGSVLKSRIVCCPDCQHVLQYELKDIVRDEDGFNDYIECPVCGEAILSIPESRSYQNEFERYW